MKLEKDISSSRLERKVLLFSLQTRAVFLVAQVRDEDIKFTSEKREF